MRLLILILAFCLFDTGSVTTLPVDVERSHPSHVVRGRQADLSIMAHSFLSKAHAAPVWPQPQLDFNILSTELVAWSLKYSHSGFPPLLGEECIILVSYSTNGIAQWQLGCMDRVSSTAPWIPSAQYDPYLKWRESFGDRPSVAEISEFLKETNFGYNDFSNTEVLKVVLYVNSPVLLDALSNPISDEEKEKRRIISESYQSGVEAEEQP